MRRGFSLIVYLLPVSCRVFVASPSLQTAPQIIQPALGPLNHLYEKWSAVFLYNLYLMLGVFLAWFWDMMFVVQSCGKEVRREGRDWRRLKTRNFIWRVVLIEGFCT